MSWGGPYGGKACGGKGGKGEEEPSDNLYVTGLPSGIDDEFVKALFQSYGTIMQCRVLPLKAPGASMHALVRFSSVEEATTIKNTVSGGTVDGSTEPLNCTYASKPKPQQTAPTGSWFGGGSWGKATGATDASSDGGKANSWGNGGKGASWGDGGKAASWGDGGKSDGGKGDGGKGKKGKSTTLSMDVIMEAFHSAKCLPGAEFGNDHNCLYVAGLPSDCGDQHLYRLFAPFGALTPGGVKVMTHPDGNCKGFGFVNYMEALEMQAAAQLLDGAQLPDGSTLTVKAK